MVKEILKYRFKISSIAGIYCNISPSGTKTFRIVRVDYNKGNLDFDLLGEAEDDYDAVAELTKKLPVYLAVDGKGILLKNVVPDSEKPLINQVIPGAQEDEFVLDSYAGRDSLHVAIARKELLDDTIVLLKKAGVNVICLALGPLRVGNLIKYFNELPDAVAWENNRLVYSRKENVIDRIERLSDGKDQIFKIDSKPVSSVYLPALSVALEFFLEEGHECVFKEVNESKKEFQSKVVFQRSGFAFLIFIFLILFINMGLYMHYKEGKREIENRLTGNRNILNEIDSLRQDLAWKKQYLKSSGFLNNSRMSFYADRIAATVPTEIELEKLEINPIEGKIKDNKEIVLKANTIFITGTAKSSVYVNDWVHQLKEFKWIENVDILNYKQEDDFNSGVFSFEVTLKGTEN
ncbi:MAG TPA: PilN domain-containing protein [Bacteroidales bacterium]|nr:PilN domain-containing protein [Bacteroidales bacterium]